MNYLENLRTQTIDIATAGDNTLITAPTTDGNYIAIDFIQIFVPAALAVTMKNGTTAINGVYTFQAGQNVTIENAMKNEHGVITCSPNTAFVINLGAALQCSGFIRYRVVGN